MSKRKTLTAAITQLKENPVCTLPDIGPKQS